MLKRDRTKILVDVMTRLEEDLDQTLLRSDNPDKEEEDIRTDYYDDEEELIVMRSPTEEYETVYINNIDKRSLRGNSAYPSGLNVRAPIEARGWPPGLIEYLFRMVTITVDAVLDNIMTPSDMDNQVDNILRGVHEVQ